VLGCILCDHYISSGLPGGPKTIDGSVEKLCRHIDKIHELTGTYDNIGIGSDLDGYIKPALAGLEHMGRMGELQERLRQRYGDGDAEKICSANALRVLRAEWKQAASASRRSPWRASGRGCLEDASETWYRSSDQLQPPDANSRSNSAGRSRPRHHGIIRS
jgi:hypothetical protein